MADAGPNENGNGIMWFFRELSAGYSKSGGVSGNTAKEARRLLGDPRCKANDEMKLHCFSSQAHNMLSHWEEWCTRA